MTGGLGAMGGGVRVVAVAGLRSRVAGFRRLRHVLGLDQPGDDLKRAVIADGDDAPGHREVLAAPHCARLDGALDLVEAGLDTFGLGQRLLGPLVVVELGEFGLAGLQLPDLRLLLPGPLGGLRLDSAVARGVVPRGFDHGDGPLPAGRQLVGGRLELRHGERLQQHRVLEPDAVLVFVGEQVAHDRAAGGLVGVDPNEPGDRRAAGHALLGQQALHLPGRRAVALGRDLFPDRHLALAVGGDGEGLQHFEVDLAGAVGVQQLGCGVAEAQPLLDDALGRAETRRDGRDRLPGLDQFGEGDHLIRRVHRDADDVLGERDFAGLDAVPLHLAGHRMVGVDRAVTGQFLHGLEAASAGDHGVALGAVLIGLVGPDDQVLQQVDGGDRRLELGVGAGVGRGLADVLGGQRKQGERDLPNARLGPGGDEVHANLPRWFVEKTEAESENGSHRPVPRRPDPRPAPLRTALRAGPGCGGGAAVWAAPGTNAIRDEATAGSPGGAAGRAGSHPCRARPRWSPVPEDRDT